jgi:dienelactone hydrolase
MTATLLCAARVAIPAEPSFEYDRSAPLGLRDSAVALRDVEYVDAAGKTAAATLVSPRTPGRHPAVLFVHWYDPHEPTSSRVQFLPDAMRLARQGVVSLLVDTLWTDPQWFNARDPGQDLPHLVVQVKNLRRALDLLSSLPDVDPQRLHYVGHDFGAMYGTVLASADRRLRSFVFIAGTKAFADWFLLGRKPDPALRQSVEDAFRLLDPLRTVAAVAPAPILFQFATKDPYVPKEAADALVAAAKDPKEVKIYEAGHGMNFAALEDRVGWLLAVVERKGP